MENKFAQTQLAIHPLIKQRWSPRAFNNRNVELDKLERIFEAARWAASCFNEQPWRFIVGLKGQNESYQKIFNILAPANQLWCKNVPVLVLLIAKKTFSHNGKPNKWALYDLGQAAAHLALQALAEGLHVHQMAGFDSGQAQKVFKIPSDFKAVTVMAVGYLAKPETLPENLRALEMAQRQRKSLKQLVFSESWNNPFFTQE